MFWLHLCHNLTIFFDHLNSDHRTAIIVRKSTKKSTYIHHSHGIFDQFSHVIRNGSDLFLHEDGLPDVGVPIVLADCTYHIRDQQLSGMYMHDEQLETQFFEESHRDQAE